MHKKFIHDTGVKSSDDYFILNHIQEVVKMSDEIWVLFDFNFISIEQRETFKKRKNSRLEKSQYIAQSTSTKIVLVLVHDFFNWIFLPHLRIMKLDSFAWN